MRRCLYKDTVGPYEQADQNKQQDNKDHKRRPANPPARLAFRQRKRQTRPRTKPNTDKNGAEAQKQHPQDQSAKGHSGLTTASLSKTCEMN